MKVIKTYLNEGLFDIFGSKKAEDKDFGILRKEKEVWVAHLNDMPIFFTYVDKKGLTDEQRKSGLAFKRGLKKISASCKAAAHKKFLEIARLSGNSHLYKLVKISKKEDYIYCGASITTQTGNYVVYIANQVMGDSGWFICKIKKFKIVLTYVGEFGFMLYPDKVQYPLSVSMDKEIADKIQTDEKKEPLKKSAIVKSIAANIK